MQVDVGQFGKKVSFPRGIISDNQERRSEDKAERPCGLDGGLVQRSFRLGSQRRGDTPVDNTQRRSKSVREQKVHQESPFTL